MNDDPTKITASLVAEHGLDGAKQAALDGVMDAQRAGDNYRLSIWRDVRRVLEAWVEGWLAAELSEQNMYLFTAHAAACGKHAARTRGYAKGQDKIIQ